MNYHRSTTRPRIQARKHRYLAIVLADKSLASKPCRLVPAVFSQVVGLSGSLAVSTSSTAKSSSYYNEHETPKFRSPAHGSAYQAHADRSNVSTKGNPPSLMSYVLSRPSGSLRSVPISRRLAYVDEEAMYPVPHTYDEPYMSLSSTYVQSTEDLHIPGPLTSTTVSPDRRYMGNASQSPWVKVEGLSLPTLPQTVPSSTGASPTNSRFYTLNTQSVAKYGGASPAVPTTNSASSILSPWTRPPPSDIVFRPPRIRAEEEDQAPSRGYGLPAHDGKRRQRPRRYPMAAEDKFLFVPTHPVRQNGDVVYMPHDARCVGYFAKQVHKDVSPGASSSSGANVD
ncbi:hypothetical protein FISHEDRAFT_70714 [Fistulina hepatica ATCC 64428]|uniref:Uncharacterized protein n=1 Tax=Fistulina hepatica ATCC 64428 TaxID=1128425 RepID=A0A0D7AL17_9AGAR|nr:hypothetical protein FISHEDRAFT_70714 [Fistulina hepatica ATCC 64428]